MKNIKTYSEQKTLNIFVSLVFALLIFKSTVYLANRFKIFRGKESLQLASTREYIHFLNMTSFKPGGLVPWGDINNYKENKCLIYDGEITWNILKMSTVQQDAVYFNSNQQPRVEFVSEDAIMYYHTHGIIPRHFMRSFLSYQKGDFLYTSWKNFSLKDDSPGARQLNAPPLCTRVLNEVRRATPEELEQYKKIDPELFSPPQH